MSQPLFEYKYNAERNKQKALYGLKGILFGVVADKSLNETELLYLECWARNQRALFRDGDCIDLLDAIGDVLADGVITAAELQDIKQLIEDISHYKYRSYSEPDWEAGINTLLGYIQGLIADQALNDVEIHHISAWLNENGHLTDYYPANILTSRISRILADGIVTEDERDELLEVLRAVTGDHFDETGIPTGTSNYFVGEHVESLDYTNKLVCVTGKFAAGPRQTIKRICEEMGATVVDNVTQQMHVLIVGPISSPDWRFTSHGRKIEKALLLKNQGFAVTIITEETWLRHISE